MRGIITTAATALAALAVAGPAAAQAPIMECGAYSSVRNITTRDVSCSDARSFIRKWFVDGPYRPGVRYVTYRGWRTYRVVGRGSGNWADVRATRGSHVIRFHPYVGPGE